MDEEPTEPGSGKLRFDPARTRTGTVAERPTNLALQPKTPAPRAVEGEDALPMFSQISTLTARVEHLEWWRPIWALTAGAMGAVVVIGMAAIAGAAAAFLATTMLN